jgi:hypothetical protein
MIFTDIHTISQDTMDTIVAKILAFGYFYSSLIQVINNRFNRIS